MNIVQAEENLKKITTKFSKESFIFDLMTAYDFPKSTISKLKIKYKDHDDVVVPSKLHFVGVTKKELDSKFDELVKHYSTAKKAPRFIVVTDYQNLKAYDNKVAEKLDTEIKNLSKHPDFFLPWAGIEKKIFQGENPADVKAAEKLAKLFDLILKDNLKLVEKNRHALNVFLTRILFCFFAEDTDIFKKGLFTESLASHTNADGSDLDDYLQRLFEVLNKKSRSGLPDFLKEFPYVNGGLFAEEFPIPKFSKRSRESLIDLGSDLNWAEINPDIFGSMIQAVVHPDQRAGLGMHYTSVTNIMKVIEPLFLTELKEEFASAKGNKNKLRKLLDRIEKIKIFDPACGSGNFLIIAYKELRLLEMDILRILGGLPVSKIFLSNFHGIEIDDFAHEVAKLSLWLAEHQMNVLFSRELGGMQALLPLKDTGKIICGNAARINWDKVCPKSKESEIYIIGNPPYLGFNMQSPEQTEDIKSVLVGQDNYKFLDYIVCWFIKAARYIDHNSKFAFVTTNSVCQGTQVPIIWPHIFKLDLEIFFAYPEFTWTNNAKNKAAVICSIIGIRKKSKEPKYIIQSGHSAQVKNINAYLVNGGDIIVTKRQKPLSDLSEIATGNIPYDGGHLILTEQEARDMIKLFPNSKKFIKKLSGSKEFINGINRYCIWIEVDQVEEASSIAPIKERISLVKKSREAGGKIAKNYKDVPYRFYMTNRANESSIIIPRVSSMRREYIPMGYLSADTIISDSAQAIYDPAPHVFGVINSRMHMVWMRALAGRLKSDYRYSAVICYNTFPIPSLTDPQKEKIFQLSLEIIKARENYSVSSLATLYDPEKMPKELKEAHSKLDLYVDRLYKKDDFISDTQRLEYLFSLYESLSNQNPDETNNSIEEDEEYND